MWKVEFTDEWEEWYNTLTDEDKINIDASVIVLETLGPALGRPHVDQIKSSNYKNMKELRTQSGGRPLRSFFAFDPDRTAILLIGGDKKGNNKFYKEMIPIADKIWKAHLDSLKKGKSDG